MSASHSFVQKQGDKKKVRLDTALGAEFAWCTRGHASKLIEGGHVTINGTTQRKSLFKIKAGDKIEVTVSEAAAPSVVEGEDLPLTVVHEDEHVLLVHKAAGMVVHPSIDADAHFSGTLVNGLLHRYGRGGLSSCNDPDGIRPGIVHRIDKDTSGLLVVCRTDSAHMALMQQFEDHSVNRVYVAIVHGLVKDDSGTVDSPIFRHPTKRKKRATVLPGGRLTGKEEGARAAVTHYRVLERFPCPGGGFSLIEAELETGRTHQVRVHMASLSHPLLCDPEYGPSIAKAHSSVVTTMQTFADYGQFLHARLLGFVHPHTQARVVFEVGLPQEFETVMATLRVRNVM